MDLQVNPSFQCVFILCGLSLTLVELKFICKSMQVFHRLATQRKLTQVDYTFHPYMCEIYDFFVTCAKLRAKSLCKFWFCKLASTCIELASLVGQGLDLYFRININEHMLIYKLLPMLKHFCINGTQRLVNNS